MDSSDITTGLFTLEQAPVRHLWWLATAPQLIDTAASLDAARYLPPGLLPTLRQWDRYPVTAPARLMATPQRRLGHYFEGLYEVFLAQLLGWEILLRNQQIQSGGRTLGELDFVVRNPHTGRAEHHEIAIKFYLGVADSGSGVRWFGPNARDRLDLKATHLMAHQSRRTHMPETLELLSEHGITGPLEARIFMPGYLFYPLNTPLPAPPGTPPDHLRGWWVYADEAAAMDTSTWVQLNKPHWIGPWHQRTVPPATDACLLVRQVEQDRIPRLFADLEYHSPGHHWRERRRLFVVPRSWPGTS